MAITLSDLRTRTRNRADMESSNFVTDVVFNSWLNEAYHELWDLVVATFADHFVTSADFTVNTGNNTYTLPSDFYRIRALDRDPDTTGVYEVHRFNFGERHRQLQLSYRIRGGVLELQPEDLAPGSYRIWYVQASSDLANDAATISTHVERWAEFIILGAAIKALQKQEDDVSALLAERERITRRIKSMVGDRDANEPDRVQDIRRWGLRRLPGAQ